MAVCRSLVVSFFGPLVDLWDARVGNTQTTNIASIDMKESIVRTSDFNNR